MSVVKSVLRYDFEMYSADNPQISAGLGTRSGLADDSGTHSNKVIARFRDPETAEAVSAAPPIVRLFLEEAGFGLNVAEVADRDDDAQTDASTMRRTLVKQVTAALSNRALKKALARAAKESSFDVAAFISTVVSKDPAGRHCELPEFVSTRKVMPRRPGQLRGRGIKSRLRPQ